MHDVFSKTINSTTGAFVPLPWCQHVGRRHNSELHCTGLQRILGKGGHHSLH
jgi:hypothetical protein